MAGRCAGTGGALGGVRGGLVPACTQELELLVEEHLQLGGGASFEDAFEVGLARCGPARGDLKRFPFGSAGGVDEVGHEVAAMALPGRGDLDGSVEGDSELVANRAAVPHSPDLDWVDYLVGTGRSRRGGQPFAASPPWGATGVSGPGDVTDHALASVSSLWWM